MSNEAEIQAFESQFQPEVIEIVAVTGASDYRGVRSGCESLWTRLIDLIAWRDLSKNEPVIKEKVSLQWLFNEENHTSVYLNKNSVVRLLVRKTENSMMLVKVLNQSYKDDELHVILQESLQPIYYEDDRLGHFELDKEVNLFEQKVSWAGEEGILYFDWNEDEQTMKAAVETARLLFQDQQEWNKKIRAYAAKELVALANEWQNNEAPEITPDLFMNRMEFESISVQPDGGFDLYFADGDMFWGHCIIVEGNINGEFQRAYMAG